jgi:hypothetical protein
MIRKRKLAPDGIGIGAPLEAGSKRGESVLLAAALAALALLSLSLLTFAQQGALQSAQTERSVLDSQRELPLSFVPNRGQTDKRVRFYTQAANHAFYFTQDKAVLSFTKGKRGVALQLTPLGANAGATLEASDRGPGKVNYLVGAERHTNIPTYGEVAYRDLWPGVDLVFRGRGGVLKYELHLRPGADPSRIGLAYGGAKRLSIGKAGNLLIQTPLGTLRDSRPRSYQRVDGKRVPVGSRYALKKGGSAYGFELGASYDPRRPLVIDPGLAYSTYLGGTGSDFGHGIGVDGSGNAYVTGDTGSSDFPTSPGAFDTSFNGGAGDVFVTKLNPAGSGLAYSTYLGGTDIENGWGIAVDGSGSAYLTGKTNSSDFPTTSEAFDTTFNPVNAQDAFVTKLDASGALAYSTYLGESAGDIGFAIAVDGSGSAYVTGVTQGEDFPVTGLDTTINSADAFVTKFSPDGSSLVYSTFLGESAVDTGWGIALDASGNAYVTGQTESEDFPVTLGAFDTSLGGIDDLFVTKLNAAGSALAYSTYLGGAGQEFEFAGIAVDGSGNAHVTSRTESTDFPTTLGAFDTSLDGTSDAIVTKLNATGSTLAYSTYLGGDGDDWGRGIALDTAGNAYVTGTANSSDFPTSVGAFDTTGINDAFVTKLNAAGSALSYSTYLGGPSCPFESGYGIDLHASGSVFVTGVTCPSDFPTTAGAFDTSHNGLTDAFVTKLDTPNSPGYPHPKGATPLRVSLVPAYNQCTAPNRTHGPPDIPGGTNPDGSCNPPVQSSGQLTVGTFDANGASAASVGFARMAVVVGNPATTADEADVALTARITDVRNQGDLSDYTGELQASFGVRITDRYNLPSKSDAATVEDLQFAFTIPCAATAGSTDIGGSCSLTTSADAVTPGVIRESTRTIWQLDQAHVFDGGADGDVDTAPNTLFAVQGVFVP